MKLCTKDLVLQFEESEFDHISQGFKAYAVIFIHNANNLLRDEMMKWPIRLDGGDLHTPPKYHSRLTPPQAIKEETAEDVLRDLVKWNFAEIKNVRQDVYEEFIERARKVLK